MSIPFGGYVYIPTSANCGEPTPSLMVKHETIARTTSGNAAVIAPVAGKKIRIISGFYQADRALTMTFKSSGGSVLFGAVKGTEQGFAWPPNPHGWFKDTPVGEGVNLDLDINALVGGDLAYIEI